MNVNRAIFAVVLAAAVFSLAGWSFGQNRPVIGPGATAFDPEPGVVNSGGVIDAQAVVSADRKYVTINMGPSVSNVIELRPFPVQAVAGLNGFIGGIRPAPAPEPGNGVVALIVTDPTPEHRSDPKLLDRPGMVRLSAAR